MCIPAISNKVYKEAFLQNTSSYPLLAGEVSVFGEKGLVGTTKISYISPGEKFKTSLGVRSDIRVLYNTYVDNKTSGLIKEEEKDIKKIRLELDSFARNEETVKVYQTLPVSESSDIKIKINTSETTTGLKEETKNSGIYFWTVNLKPEKKLN